MYTLAVQRDFIAHHFLTNHKAVPESVLQPHHYHVEIKLKGQDLDPAGYLVDLQVFDQVADQLIGQYQNQALNELVEFEGLNPSLEQFARILCQGLVKHMSAPNIRSVTVKLWENESAWASYQMGIS